MGVYRLAIGAVLCVAVAAPASAQMPPGPGCLCLKQSMDALQSDMQARQDAYNAAQAELARLDSQLAAARAQEDVNNPQSVAQFRQLLEQRDAAYRQSNGDVITALQAATAAYNQAVGDYNTQCAGRPLPPPPPGPLACPGAR